MTRRIISLAATVCVLSLGVGQIQAKSISTFPVACSETTVASGVTLRQGNTFTLGFRPGTVDGPLGFWHTTLTNLTTGTVLVDYTSDFLAGSPNLTATGLTLPRNTLIDIRSINTTTGEVCAFSISTSRV